MNLTKQNKQDEVVLNSMDSEDNYSQWTKFETRNTIWSFVIAFVGLLAFGYLVNEFILIK